MTAIAQVLLEHVQSVRNQRCACDWRPDTSKSILEPDNVYAQHRAHVAQALTAAGFGNQRDAWEAGQRAGVINQCNWDGNRHEPDEITNPYQKGQS